MTGTLILIAGHAGVGKTTLATTLCETNPGWVLLDKDTATGPVVSAAMYAHTGSPDDRHSQPYVDHVRPAEYAAFTDTALTAAAYGATVLAVAPWAAQLADSHWLSTFEQSATITGLTIAGLWVTCGPDQHLARLISRDSPRDRPKIAAPSAWLTSLTTPPLPKWMQTFDVSAPHHPTATAYAATEVLSAAGAHR